VAVLAGLAAPLALILVVVAVAANGYRLAGVLAAVSAAAWFDFFLTLPYERFTITRRTDIETTVLLLAIGAAVTEIAVWSRRQHGTAARRAGYLEGINTAARSVATGGSAAALTGQVCGHLAGLLSLAGCRFQDGNRGDRQPCPAAAKRHDRVRRPDLGRGAGRPAAWP
jgi:K+-sensing histidine kinase KdpD